jgi:hypothetical protein
MTEPLYLNDDEIAARVGVGKDKWRDIAKALEPKGLPPRDPVFCNRRHWQMVKEFLDRRAGVGKPQPSEGPFWEERFDGKDGKRARSQSPATV